MNIFVKFFAISLLISNISFAQNIGQKGGTSLNYKDINGSKQGHWKKDYPNGKLAYDANFVNNKLVGNMKRYYKNTKLMIDVTYDKNSNGHAKLYWDNGRLMAEGNYIDEKIKDSVWNYYSTKGQMLATETYINGKLNGLSQKNYTNGNPVETIEWIDGKKSGKWLKYYNDGSVMLKAKNKDGIRDGYYVIYHENKRVEIKGQYKNNKRFGKWEFFDVDGKLTNTLNYDLNGRAKNRDKIDRENYLRYEKMQKDAEKYMDPNDYLNNPEEYMRKGGLK